MGCSVFEIYFTIVLQIHSCSRTLVSAGWCRSVGIGVDENVVVIDFKTCFTCDTSHVCKYLEIC